LVEAEEFVSFTDSWHGRIKPKMTLKGMDFDLGNPLTTNSDYPVKDCKWESLVLRRYRVNELKKIFFCIGLATPAPYNNIEYPQIIGLHTDPEIPYPSAYPD